MPWYQLSWSSARWESCNSLRSIGIRSEDLILPGIEGPHNYEDPRNLGHSEWYQKLEKLECVYSLHDHQQKTFPSGQNGCVRAVRDTPVVDYSAPGVNTTCRAAYRPPIAVSPFLHVLSVSYFKQTIWRCGQLWPYVGMGWLGTHLHRNCNGWRWENRCSRSFYIKLEERRNTVRRYDTTLPWESTQLHGSTKSRKEQVRPKVGNDRVCIFVVWQDEMKIICCQSTLGSPEYILHVSHSTSITCLSPYTHRRFVTV